MAYSPARTTSYLKHLAAELLERQTERGVLITITDFKLDRAGREATAYLTVWPEEAEAAALRRARQLYQPWRELVSEKTKRRLAPRINFMIDKEAKRLNQVDKALRELKINKGKPAR